MEHETEWDKLTERGSDYDEFLRMGHVTAKPDDVPSWRAEMRAKARADKLRIRTFAYDSGHVHAVRPRDLIFDELAQSMREVDVIGQAYDRAGLRGHDCRTIRVEHGLVAARCRRCGARVYVDTTRSPPFMEGEAFDDDCTVA